MMLKSLPIRLKLLLLAGVPVLGAIVLAYLVGADAQRRLDSAKALGAIEDLARLASLMSGTVDAVQEEREHSAILLAQGKPMSGAAPQRSNVDQKVAQLRDFLAGRDVNRLPKRLAQELGKAQSLIAQLPQSRKALEAPEAPLDTVSTLGDELNTRLIGATAALGSLSDDGVMLRNIQALVTVLELQERASREAALLSYVFHKQLFPPGSYKVLVNLVTEQATFENVFRQSSSQELVELFDRKAHGPLLERAQALERVALDAIDDNFGVDPVEWANVQDQKVLGYRGLSELLNQRVREAALSKIREATAAVSLARRVSLGVVATSLGLAILIALGISRSIRSLASAAHEVQATGNFSIRAQKMSGDELGKLTDVFNEMLEGIGRRDEELAHHRENLEHLVQERTQELEQRNLAMRVVLDNVEQGLATILPDGQLAEETSLAFTTMFPATTGRFSEVLAANDNALREMLELGWEGLTDGFLPPDIAIDQIPKKIRRDGRHYELSYKPMGAGAFGGALLVVNDVTALVAQRAKEEEQRELLAVFEAVSRDKSGFAEFFNDAERMVTDLECDAIEDLLVLRRVLHTLKGNTAIFGVTSVATVAHEVETASLEEDRRPNGLERAKLGDAWQQFANRIRSFTGNQDEDWIEIQYAELERILAAVQSQKPHAELRTMLEALRLEPTSVRLNRIADQAQRLAKKLNKAELRIVVESGGLRLPSDVWGDVWSSLVHVVRNALDHGIESADERISKGKPAGGQLTLTTKVDGKDYVVELSDDGRGIDWGRVAEKADKLGLPCKTQAELEQALLADGLSTRDEATDLSGRGVGMSAVSSACRALGGRLEVHSTLGKGTSWRLIVPREGHDQPSPLSVRPGVRPSIRPASVKEPSRALRQAETKTQTQK